MSKNELHEINNAIDFHQDKAEVMRYVGWRKVAATHCRRVKELNLHRMLND